MEAAEKTPTPELNRRMLDNQKDGERLVSMCREHAGRIGAEVAETLGVEHGPAVVALLNAVCTHVGALGDAMMDAEVKLTLELADDAAPRNARDRHEKQLRESIVDVRERVVGIYGQPVLSTFLLAGGAPRDPRQLVTWAQRAADAIEAADIDKLPPSRIEGAKATPKKWAALLQKPAAALSAAIGDVDREAAEAVTALAARNTARDGFEQRVPRAYTLLDGLLRFAGMDAEANRVARPTARTASDDDTPANDPVTPPANDARPR